MVELCSTHHSLKTSLTNVITFKCILSLLLLNSFSFKYSFFLFCKIPLDLDLLFLIYYQDSLWGFKWMRFWLKKFFSLLEIFQNLSDLFVLFFNCEPLIFLVLLKLKEFFVEIFFQVKDDLFDELNLISLSHISE
jgi:hypothetical protein